MLEIWMAPLGKPGKKYEEEAPLTVPESWPESSPSEPVPVAPVPEREPLVPA